MRRALGVKGYEDLGGGLKANYMLECGVNPDGDGTDNTAGFSRRNQWVGMSGDSWGEFRVGRHDTPLKLAQGNFDQFNDTDADIQNTTLGEQRIDNTITYVTPSFSGFTVWARWFLAKRTTATKPATTASALTVPLCPLLSPLGTSRVTRPVWPTSTRGRHLQQRPVLRVGGLQRLRCRTQGSSAVDSLCRGVATYQFGDLQVGGLYEGGELECNDCDEPNLGRERQVRLRQCRPEGSIHGWYL